METNYRGFEIRQPVIFSRKPGAKGNGLTSITIKGPNGGVLKTFQVKKFNNVSLVDAIEKAHYFIDDLLLVGKPVLIESGPDAGKTGTVDEVNRRKVKKKSVVFITVNTGGEPPFKTYNLEQIKIL